VVLGAVERQRQPPPPGLLLHGIKIRPRTKHVDVDRAAGAGGVLVEAVEELGVALGPQDLSVVVMFWGGVWLGGGEW
jgi:hypothetical protein